MIITKLQGGIGNQLFQWAYAKSLSVKYNTSMCLDITPLRINIPSDTRRVFSLNLFPKLKFRLFDKSVDRPVYRVTDDFNFKPLNYDSKYSYYLDGYWQSEKYFIESENIIRGELEPDIISRKKLSLTPFIDSNTISLHVRRTDYLTSNGYHPVQPISYYEKALEVIGDYDYIFVFSDDIGWCKNNLHFKNIIFIENFTDVESIWLMSMCKNNIIVNSSFSWWGAWLNINPDKKIIAPIYWFGDKNLNSSDIIPSNWIKI